VHPQEGEQDLVAQDERKQRLLEKKKAMKAVADAEAAARARGLGSGLVVAEGQDFEFVGTGLVGAVTTAAGKEGATAGAGAGAYFLSHPCTSACTHIRLFFTLVTCFISCCAPRCFKLQAHLLLVSKKAAAPHACNIVMAPHDWLVLIATGASDAPKKKEPEPTMGWDDFFLLITSVVYANKLEMLRCACTVYLVVTALGGPSSPPPPLPVHYTWGAH
jgi:hypothetical protein